MAKSIALRASIGLIAICSISLIGCSTSVTSLNPGQRTLFIPDSEQVILRSQDTIIGFYAALGQDSSYLGAPRIFYSEPYLYLSFRGTNNDEIYVGRTSDFGKTLSLQTIPTQAIDYTPGLTLVGSELILAWRGTDSDHRINAMSTNTNSSNPLASFSNQVIYGDQANGAVSMVTYAVDGKPYIAWAGTDSGHSLNVMPLPPYLNSGYI